MNAPVIFFLFRSNCANWSNGTVEKWVFIAKIYGQLTKQHTEIWQKTTTNRSFLPQFDGFRIRRVVLERVNSRTNRASDLKLRACLPLNYATPIAVNN